MESKQAERILEILGDNMTEGKEFVIEQAPDVVQQLVLYAKIDNGIGVVFCGTLALIAVAASLRWIRQLHGTDLPEVSLGGPDKSGVRIKAGVAGALGLVFSLAGIGAALQLAKACVAPKLYVLEYLLNKVN